MPSGFCQEASEGECYLVIKIHLRNNGPGRNDILTGLIYAPAFLTGSAALRDHGAACHSPFTVLSPGGASGDEPAERAASLGLSCRWRLHGPEMRRSALPVRENRTVDRSGDP